MLEFDEYFKQYVNFYFIPKLKRDILIQNVLALCFFAEDFVI